MVRTIELIRYFTISRIQSLSSMDCLIEMLLMNWDPIYHNCGNAFFIPDLDKHGDLFQVEEHEAYNRVCNRRHHLDLHYRLFLLWWFGVAKLCLKRSKQAKSDMVKILDVYLVYSGVLAFLVRDLPKV